MNQQMVLCTTVAAPKSYIHAVVNKNGMNIDAYGVPSFESMHALRQQQFKTI